MTSFITNSLLLISKSQALNLMVTITLASVNKLIQLMVNLNLILTIKMYSVMLCNQVRDLVRCRSHLSFIKEYTKAVSISLKIQSTTREISSLSKPSSSQVAKQLKIFTNRTKSSLAKQ